MKKEKPKKYKLKKGIKWETAENMINQGGYVFLDIFEEDVKSKYNNEKEEHEGIKFDSKAEKEFYIYLLKYYKKEEIILQPKFILQEKFKDNSGNSNRAVTYIADFQIGNTVYDVKGVTTPAFKIKAKSFKLKYSDLDLQVVRKAPKWTGKEWIDLQELKKMIKEKNKNKQEMIK